MKTYDKNNVDTRVVFVLTAKLYCSIVIVEYVYKMEKNSIVTVIHQHVLLCLYFVFYLLAFLFPY
jgi:hypothetical protein